MKLIRKRAWCLCEGINLVLVAPMARGIIHEPSISHSLPPPPPPGMRNITPSQEQAFTLQLCQPWQNRVVIMWNYWYKQTDEWPLRSVCVYVFFLNDVYARERTVFACVRVKRYVLVGVTWVFALEWVCKWATRTGLCWSERNWVMWCGLGAFLFPNQSRINIISRWDYY